MAREYISLATVCYSYKYIVNVVGHRASFNNPPIPNKLISLRNGKYHYISSPTKKVKINRLQKLDTDLHYKINM